MIDADFAGKFSHDWIDAWNSHDLNRVLAHYSEGFEMSSPVICQIAKEPSGKLTGKKAVGFCWAKALSLFPDLHFELIATFAGVNSITLNFEWERGLASEVFVFGPDLKVIKAYAHHAVNS